MGFAPWVAPSGCLGGPQTGAVDLQEQLLELYAAEGASSWGIYNCRRVAGAGSPWSVHAEGRALDLAVPTSSDDLGYAVLGALVGTAGAILQRVIWDHQTYDLVTPDGRPYTGQSPHVDHLHIELSWAAARGEIPLLIPDDHDSDEDPMPMLIVAWRGAQWVVSPDLSGKVGLSQSADVTALLRAGAGRLYVPASLSEGLMAKIPVRPLL